MEVGGVFPNEKIRSRLLSPARKVIMMIWSSTLSISNTALLNRFTQSLKLSPSCCLIVNK